MSCVNFTLIVLGGRFQAALMTSTLSKIFLRRRSYIMSLVRLRQIISPKAFVVNDLCLINS